MENVSMSVGILQTIILCSFVLLIIAFVGIFYKPFSSKEKFAWILTVLFVPILGSIIYFIFADSNRQDKISKI